MKKILILSLLLFVFGCNDDPPKQPTIQYILILDGKSYNFTEEAYYEFSNYLEFLQIFYANENNSDQIINQLEKSIAEGIENNIENNDDVIEQEEIKLIIEEIQENSDIPTVPGLEEFKYAPLTILSYLVANNNLDDYLLANIGAMYDGLATMTEPAVLLVYWDGQTSIGVNKSKHLILKYETDGKGNINGNSALDFSATLDDVLAEAEIIKEYNTQLSTDKQVMKTVLNDMIAFSPTTKHGLLLGSHASSWLNSIFTSRSFGQDGSGTDNTMLIPDMVEALESVGKPFEFVLFDACYMGTMEVAHAFRNVARYQISSVMEVPAYGFPYESFMKDLYAGTVNGYQNVCQAYIDYYKDTYSSGEYAWATVALIDSKEMEALTDQLKQTIVANKEMLADYDGDHLQEYGKSSGPYIASDLGHFVKDLNGGTLPATFNDQLAKTVIYKGCLEKARPLSYSVNATNYSGLGMYIPVSVRPRWNTYFQTLDWYTAAGWNEVTFSWDF